MKKSIKGLTSGSLFINRCNSVTFDSPFKLIVSRCDFKKKHYFDDLFDILKIDCPANIRNSIPKRRAEFLAGRYVAKLSLRELNICSFNVAIGKHRNPVWPKRIVASISHTNSTALCAAAYKHDTEYLGIDFENWITSETIKEIKNNIIHSHEEKLLQNIPVAFNKAFTLVFSAKESLFKALHPSVGCFFDFLDAEITEICIIQNKLKLKLSKSLTIQQKKGTQFEGQFQFETQGVLTLIAK